MKRVSLLDLRKARPAESLRVEFFPDRRLVGILVTDVENRSENLRIITREVEREAEVIIMRPSSPASKIIDLLYYVECEKGAEERIASRIEKLEAAREVIVIEPPDERLALSPFFPIRTLGERSIIMRESLYNGMFNGLRDQMGEGGAKAFLHLLGLSIGRKIAKSLKPLLRHENLIKCLEILMLIARAQGFFNIGKIEAAEDEIIVDLLDNWEAASLEEKYKKKGPQCF